MMQKREAETGDLTFSFYFLSFFCPPPSVRRTSRLCGVVVMVSWEGFSFFGDQSRAARDRREFTPRRSTSARDLSHFIVPSVCVCAYSTS